MNIKKILITGSSGTIGTRLFEKLLNKNYEVVGADSKPNRWNDQINKLTVIGDLLNKKTFDKLPKDMDLVIHLAANARVYNLIKNPNLARENFETLVNTLEFCRLNHISRFIFTSSREVYGNFNQTTHSEDRVSIRNCESPYAASKVGGESLIYAYNNCFGLNFITVRLSNVYGMYDDSDRIVPLFIKLIKENKNLTVYGKEKMLDFTYIDDAISGVMSCIENFDKAKNDVFNIASGKGVNLVKLARLIQTSLNAKNSIEIKENRKGEVLKFVANISKARKILSYNPEVDIDEGIRRTVNWYNRALYSG